jgi:hypothetical protein
MPIPKTAGIRFNALAVAAVATAFLLGGFVCKAGVSSRDQVKIISQVFSAFLSRI